MDHHIAAQDVSAYSMSRLEKELAGVQMSLEMLYTKNNSLEDLDLTEGGGSPEDQAEYQRLMREDYLLSSEINRRHAQEKQ
jgi:hypothetical protein